MYCCWDPAVIRQRDCKHGYTNCSNTLGYWNEPHLDCMESLPGCLHIVVLVVTAFRSLHFVWDPCCLSHHPTISFIILVIILTCQQARLFVSIISTTHQPQQLFTELGQSLCLLYGCVCSVSAIYGFYIVSFTCLTSLNLAYSVFNIRLYPSHSQVSYVQQTSPLSSPANALVME